MIGYVTLGTNDLDRSGRFYDQLFEMLGAKRVHSDEASIAWASGVHSTIFVVLYPVNGERATAGNGTMIALNADSIEQVDALYRQSILIGATNEGAPGIRSGGYYCAYVRDPDGNKLNFHCNPDHT